MFKSLRHHILESKKMGIGGLLFYKRYLRGILSLFQPSLDEIRLIGNDDFILGTGVETFEEEKFFKDVVCVTDYRGDRKGGRGKDAGPLICHRGL